MHRPDRFDDGSELPDELPQLPIPRPHDGPGSPASNTAPIATPRLGGGASYTTAGNPEGDPPPAPSGELTDIEREQLETQRFTWELAARLTSGMLANPARGHASVKDAMAMFDQFLQEMHAYSRIASDFDLLSADGERRRREQAEYYQRVRGNASARGAAGEHATDPAAGSRARPEPMQPRPMSGYRPLPPGARSTDVPGSMAGAPPPVEPPANESNAA